MPASVSEYLTRCPRRASSRVSSPAATSRLRRLARMLVAMPSSQPASISRKWRRSPNMTSRSTSIAHGSPSTSTAALMAHPDRGALSALDGKLVATYQCCGWPIAPARRRSAGPDEVYAPTDAVHPEPGEQDVDRRWRHMLDGNGERVPGGQHSLRVVVALMRALEHVPLPGERVDEPHRADV